jgi:hypothetical protein
VTDGRTWNDVIRGWCEDPAFRTAFAAALADDTADAFAWECAPVSAATGHHTYDHVVVPVPALARVEANEAPFAAKLASIDGDVVTFANLGGDATLVVPRPLVPGARYPHLAAFLRTAPAAQIDELWSAVGNAVARHLSDSAAPVWVSTAGLGVHWLHVRLDARPKYYRHSPFRTHP